MYEVLLYILKKLPSLPTKHHHEPRLSVPAVRSVHNAAQPAKPRQLS